MSDVLVIGAGQLGLMMAAAGARLGISVDRIDHNNGELLPGTSSRRFKLTEEETMARYPVITAELEHLLGNDLVEGLRRESAWCNAQAMALLPARDQQKSLLDHLRIPTSPWCVIESPADLEEAHEVIGDELVVKSIRDGYDGKGQWITSSDDDGDIPKNVYGSIIAERRIPFEREVSLVGARFPDGNMVYYPLVENYHQDGMLRFTLSTPHQDADLENKARNMLGALMRHLDYVGVMAMECFQVGDELLVNEVAPRVHNSGHWTQAGAFVNQFDLHLSAVLNRPIETLSLRQGHTLMLNLIGCHWNSAWQELEGVQCWWYGKSFRKNRKLGHINLHERTPEALIRASERLRSTLDPFHQDMLTLGMDRIGSL